MQFMGLLGINEAAGSLGGECSLGISNAGWIGHHSTEMKN